MCHGLTSGPRESASEAFLNELLQLVRYPPRSAPAFLAGTLLLKYCAVRFACKVPTWRLPVSGHAACLVTAETGVAEVVGNEVGEKEVSWVSGSGPGWKRIRLIRKNPAHFSGVSILNLGHVCSRDCVICGIQLFLLLVLRGGVMISKTRDMFLFNTGLGWMIPGASAGPRLQVCMRDVECTYTHIHGRPKQPHNNHTTIHNNTQQHTTHNTQQHRTHNTQHRVQTHSFQVCKAER